MFHSWMPVTRNVVWALDLHYAARNFQVSNPTFPMTCICVSPNQQTNPNHHLPLAWTFTFTRKTTTFQIWKTRFASVHGTLTFGNVDLQDLRIAETPSGVTWNGTWWKIHHPAIGVSCSFLRNIFTLRIYVSGSKDLILVMVIHL